MGLDSPVSSPSAAARHRALGEQEVEDRTVVDRTEQSGGARLTIRIQLLGKFPISRETVARLLVGVNARTADPRAPGGVAEVT